MGLASILVTIAFKTTTNIGNAYGKHLTKNSAYASRLSVYGK
jgi:hypothetical protein